MACLPCANPWNQEKCWQKHNYLGCSFMTQSLWWQCCPQVFSPPAPGGRDHSTGFAVSHPGKKHSLKSRWNSPKTDTSTRREYGVWWGTGHEQLISGWRARSGSGTVTNMWWPHLCQCPGQGDVGWELPGEELAVFCVPVESQCD